MCVYVLANEDLYVQFTTEFLFISSFWLLLLLWLLSLLLFFSVSWCPLFGLFTLFAAAREKKNTLTKSQITHSHSVVGDDDDNDVDDNMLLQYNRLLSFTLVLVKNFRTNTKVGFFELKLNKTVVYGTQNNKMHLTLLIGIKRVKRKKITNTLARCSIEREIEEQPPRCNADICV